MQVRILIVMKISVVVAGKMVVALIVQMVKMREERGVERLKQHRWQAGYVMPQHYRGNGYKVDYKDNNLPKPGRNQQWYKINNDFILVNADDNSIIRIMGF